MEQNSKPSLTTLQSALIINIISNMHSMDELGITYYVRAVEMAYELKLFKPSGGRKPTRKRQAYDFTAWCLYFWISFQSYHFNVVPSIILPPETALPDPQHDPDWYGEIMVKYPLNNHRFAMNYAQLFVAKCRLAIIINGITQQIFGPKTPAINSTMLRDLISQLNSWFITLPACLKPENIVFPAQMNLHLMYHLVAIHLHEAVDPDSSAIRKLKIYFDTLIRLYFLRHGFESPDAYSTYILYVLAFRAQADLNEAKDPSRIDDLCSTLILASKGLNSQGKSYYLPQMLLRVVHDKMSVENAGILNKTAGILPEELDLRQVRKAHVQASYPVEIVNIINNPDSKSLTEFIRLYAKMALDEQNQEASTSSD